jgi:hypothetical protein
MGYIEGIRLWGLSQGDVYRGAIVFDLEGSALWGSAKVDVYGEDGDGCVQITEWAPFGQVLCTGSARFFR